MKQQTSLPGQTFDSEIGRVQQVSGVDFVTSSSVESSDIDNARAQLEDLTKSYYEKGIFENSFHDYLIDMIHVMGKVQFDGERARRRLLEDLADQTIENFFLQSDLSFNDRMSSFNTKIKYLLNFDILSPNDQLSDRQKLDLLSYALGVTKRYKRQVISFGRSYINSGDIAKLRPHISATRSANSSPFGAMTPSRLHSLGLSPSNNNQEGGGNIGGSTPLPSFPQLSRCGSAPSQGTPLSKISSSNSSDGNNNVEDASVLPSLTIKDGPHISDSLSGKNSLNPATLSRRSSSEGSIKLLQSPTVPKVLRKVQSDSSIINGPKKDNLVDSVQRLRIRRDSYVSISNSVISAIDDKDFLAKSNDYLFKILLKRVELQGKLEIFNSALYDCDEIDKTVGEIRQDCLLKFQSSKSESDDIAKDIRYIAANIYRADILSKSGHNDRAEKLFENNIKNLLIKNHTREGMEDLLLKSADFCDKNNFHDLAAKCYRLMFYIAGSKYSSVFRDDGNRTYNHEYFIEYLNLSLTLSKLYEVMASNEVDDEIRNKLNRMSKKSCKDAEEAAKTSKKRKLLDDVLNFQNRESEQGNRPSFKELMVKAVEFDEKNLAQNSYSLSKMGSWTGRVIAQNGEGKDCCCGIM